MSDERGRKIDGIEVERNGQRQVVYADRYVLSCGAVNSGVLLLNSKNSHHPNGLANSSGLVGCHHMQLSGARF